MISPFSLPRLVTYLSFLAFVVADYQPESAACPTGSLIRDGKGLSDQEESYRVARKAKADEGLKSWLLKQNSAFDTSCLPTVALTHSGGGYRSLLVSAGVIQGLDARDSNVSTSGLFEGIAYQSGLSGGSWLLSSFMGNGYPTISYLRDNLWKDAFKQTLLDPSAEFALIAGAKILDDVVDKKKAGFKTSLTDPWGRLLSYQLLQGHDGGVGKTLSSITSLSKFTSHEVPFPIITALGTKTWEGDCLPGPNATTYHFTPYEFGTFDKDVSAFIPIKYLGSTVSNGSAAGSCVTGFDNLGFILGTSSSLFNEGICVLTKTLTSSKLSSEIEKNIQKLFTNAVKNVVAEDAYAIYPNPFYKYTSKTSVFNSHNNVAGQPTLHLVDGGEALQNNPVWPLLEPSRNITAIIVNDNSADTTYHWPNGTELQTTYIQAQSTGLTRMPFIPGLQEFSDKGLTQRATFFGCNNTSVITIIYIPNMDYTFQSNVSTQTVLYEEATTAAMIENGKNMINQNGTAGWGTCLGCALLKKEAGKLPNECEACFSKYCYN